MKGKKRVLVFGATGAIGAAICAWFNARDWHVIATSRHQQGNSDRAQNIRYVAYDPLENSTELLAAIDKRVDAVVWAQGQNTNDNIYNFDIKAHEALYNGNVLFILASLQCLIQHERLAIPARLCIISSIWQNIARQNKLSYTVTKSALQGLVQSLTIDMGHDKHLINAVLPGALDTPMTQKNLLPQQIDALRKLTPLNQLSTLDDVCNLVGFLCSETNTAITGQFINVDGGFSFARIL